MNQKTTKRALLASVMSLMLSLAMLIGATFAWFTDTAFTAVNKIQSGTLKLSLQYAKEYNTDGTVKTWEDAEGGTLNFLRTDGTKLSADANILWEPGATYKLPQLKISNEGSLALKYKVVISGATGDTDLLSQIDFTSKVNGGAAATFTDGATLVDGKQLLPKEGSTVHSDTIDIEGTMKTTADNKYQNKTITGIAITVAATQATYENDSISDQYDKDAKYTEVIAGGKTFTGKQTLSTGITATNPNAIAVKATGESADVTILDGTFDGGAGGNNQCVHARDGAKVTIKGGTFTVGGDQDGYGNSVIESSGGNIVIEGGFFYTNYQYRGFYYVLNQKNNKPGTITVKGGTFVNYDPSTGDDQLHGNFVADGYTVISETKANGEKWYTVVSKSNSDGLKNVLANGGALTISDEIKTNGGDTAADRVIISEPTTLQLNKKIVSPDNMGNNSTNFTALIVDADTTINAGSEGGIDTGMNGGYGINVRKGANLTINGGSYYGGGTAVQVQEGTLTINGGTFAVEPYNDARYGYKFLLNCLDRAYKNGTAKIIVKGGTFVNFDPSNNAAEGANTNFVADGYHVISQTQGSDTLYTVVAD